MPFGEPIAGAKPADYCVSEPPAQGAWLSNRSCTSLREVYHVAHVQTALSIAQAGEIKAALVKDKSTLNNERIAVVWLSPNDYPDSFYGQIRLSLPFTVKPKPDHVHWIEAIEYKRHAPRILLSNPDRLPASLKNSLQPFDPRVRQGPWYIDGAGAHWWNGDYTLEFMYAANIPVRHVQDVSFVSHHKGYCAQAKSASTACPDHQISPSEAGARFIAGLVGRGLTSLNHAFHRIDQQDMASPSLSEAYRHMHNFLVGMTYGGSITVATPVAPAVARSLLSAIDRRSAGDVRALAALFVDQAAALTSIRGALASHFQVTEDSL